MQANLHESVPQIGAPEAWAAGYDGKGVTVAVLDTGVDVNHPDLSSQIGGTRASSRTRAIADVDGHGTHVASTIVGTGAAPDGDYKGVAPGAKLDRRQGARRHRLRPGLLGHRRHGVGRRSRAPTSST